jgi:hypothetical protein
LLSVNASKSGITGGSHQELMAVPSLVRHRFESGSDPRPVPRYGRRAMSTVTLRGGGVGGLGCVRLGDTVFGSIGGEMMNTILLCEGDGIHVMSI